HEQGQAPGNGCGRDIPGTAAWPARPRLLARRTTGPGPPRGRAARVRREAVPRARDRVQDRGEAGIGTGRPLTEVLRAAGERGCQAAAGKAEVTGLPPAVVAPGLRRLGSLSEATLQALPVRPEAGGAAPVA